MSKAADNGLLIVAGIAAAAALVVAWPMIRIVWIRMKAGHVEQDGTIYDPDSESFYSTANGDLVWSPSMDVGGSASAAGPQGARLLGATDWTIAQSGGSVVRQ